MIKLAHLMFLTVTLSLTSAVIPPYKIRGVNLGSLFIVEPWMSSNIWKSIGCGNTASEWDCVSTLGRDKANAAFQKHWNTFITAYDFEKIKQYGLNTVRIPVGHWFVESTISPGENWPRGGMKFLDKVVGIAASKNISVILDLHGAPNVQIPNSAFTGRAIPNTGFYSPLNYDRAYDFLNNMTERIHTHPSYSSTFMLEVLNEPEQNHDSLLTEYYPKAYSTIRSVESDLNIPKEKALIVQMMDSTWGTGNPRRNLPKDAKGLAFDNHRYLTYSSTPATKSDYIRASCNDTFPSNNDNKPLLIGEWSLAVKQSFEWSDDFSPMKEENHKWYRQWWASQVHAYEKETGWVFWSWKTDLGGDWRWSYSDAVEAGIIPKDFKGVSDLAGC